MSQEINIEPVRKFLNGLNEIQRAIVLTACEFGTNSNIAAREKARGDITGITSRLKGLERAVAGDLGQLTDNVHRGLCDYFKQNPDATMEEVVTYFTQDLRHSHELGDVKSSMSAW